MNREIKITLKNISGLISTDYYDMTDEFGDVVFINKLGTNLVGATYSVNKLSSSFLITSYPQPFLKFVYFNTTQPSNKNDIINSYIDGNKSDTYIENIFGVGTPGSIPVICSFCKYSYFISETIYADTTSITTFWNDIRGWMYLNNLGDIELSPNQMYKIIDDVNMAFMCLTY